MPNKNIKESVEKLWKGYASAILFAETDLDTDSPLEESYNINDFDKKTISESKKLLQKFYTENEEAINESGLDLDTIGNDVWFTRAGHGAGFFDHNLDDDIERQLIVGAEELGKFPSVETHNGKISVSSGRVFADGGENKKEFNLKEIKSLSEENKKVLTDKDDNLYILENDVLYNAEVIEKPPYIKKGTSNRMSKIKLNILDEFSHGGETDDELKKFVKSLPSNTPTIINNSINKYGEVGIIYALDYIIESGETYVKNKSEHNKIIDIIEDNEMDFYRLLNDRFKSKIKFDRGGETDDLLEFTIPNWALSSLINGDDSGLEDEDIEKINKFVDKVVAKYGNAFFMMPDEDEMDLGFKHRNDIDNLGSDCSLLYLRPSKEYANGGETDDYILSKIDDLINENEDLSKYIKPIRYIILEGISEGDDIDMIEYDIEKEKDFQLSLLMNDNKLRNRLMLIYAKIEVILNSVEFADGGQTDDCMWRYENNEYTSRELIDLAEEMAEYDRQDTGEHIKINDVDSAIEYLGDVERIDIDDYPESMKYKTLGQRLLNREFGTIDLLLEESYQIPDLSPSGTYNKTMGKIQAIINEFNITENQFNKIASEYKSLDLVYSDFVNQDEDEYADGGDIPNNYEGLSEEDVWDMWTTQQKWHFLSDHADMFKRVKWGIEESFDRPIDYHDIAHSFSYQELPFAVKDAIRSHIEDGQYRKGGNVPSIEKKINELNKLISEANEKGVEVVDTDVTWQAPMKYKPIKYSNGVLYIEYEELDLYSHNRGEGTKWKTKKDKVFKNSGLGTYDQIAEINYIARMYRKAIKHFDKYGYADGGVNDTPSKKEMLDYLNMYFDYYSELRTIAVEEDNILTKRMLPTLDDEQIEMAYEDARYEVKSDTMYADGGELIDFEVGDYINWPSYHETDEFGNQFYETAKIVSIDGDEVTYEMNKYGDTYDFTFTIGDDFHKSIDHVEKMAEGGEVDIKDAVEEFVEELNNKYSDSYLFTLSFAKKYAKISHQPVVNGEVVQGKATWGFVALEDDNNKGIVIGDLLKAASVNTPAKGPRGNILKGDAQYDKYSPQYGKGWREEGGIMAKGGVVVSKLITDIKTALKDAEVRKLSDNRLRLDFYSKRAGDGKSVSKQNLLFIVDPQKEMIEFKNPDSYAKFETKYSSVRELSKFVKDSIRDWKQKDKAKYDQWKHNAWRNDRAYGGYMAKGGSVNLNQSYLSSSEFEKAKKLKDFNEEDWKWDSSKDLYAKVKKKITNKLHKFNVAANIRTSQGGRWDNHEVMARDEEEALMKVKKMYNPYGDSQFIMSNSFATKKMAKGGMTIDERMKAFKEYQQKWTTDMLRFLKGKKLGNLELINLQSEFNGIVEFSIQIDELKLNWMIKSDSIINFDEGTQKLIVYIGVNSPNRKGVFEKIVTGRNATNDMVWKTIQDIYNGKYKKMVKGGPTFDDKVDAISKALVNRKKVPKSVQKDYGKTYSKKESIESAKRIAGAMRKKEKMSRGGYVIRTKDRTIADDLLKYADLQEIPASQRKVGNIYVTKLDGKIEERSSMTSKFKDEVYPQFANYKKKS